MNASNHRAVPAPVDRARDVVAQWHRDRAAIVAAQHRIARWPLLDVLWRRPWRAPSRPNWRSLADVRQWLAAAHDCADPSVGCSCAGSFRYPRNAAR